MTKIRSVALTLIMSIVLTACGNDGNASERFSPRPTSKDGVTEAIFAHFHGSYSSTDLENIANLVFVAPKDDPIWAGLSDVKLVDAKSATITKFDILDGDVADSHKFGTLTMTLNLGKHNDNTTRLELTINDRKAYVTFGEIKTKLYREASIIEALDGYPAMAKHCSNFPVSVKNISSEALQIIGITSDIEGVNNKLYSATVPIAVDPGETREIPLALECDIDDGSFYNVTPVVSARSSAGRTYSVNLGPISIGYMDVSPDRLDAIISSGNKATINPPT